MFAFNKHIFTIARYTKSFCNNTSHINKQNLNIMFGPTVSKQLTRGLSSDIINTGSLESTTETSNESKSEAYLFDYDVITKGNKELEHKLKVIMLEAEVLRQEGNMIPSFDYIKTDMWEILLNSPSRAQRRKYLEYLFKNSKKKENKLQKKIEMRQINEESKADRPPAGQKNLSIEELASQYGLCGNNIFLRFHDTTVTRLYNSRLVQAMQFGQKIVIDCGYDQNMSRRENYNCAKQLMLLFAENRNSEQPFDIHFTNMDRESDMIKMLHKYIPTMYEPEFPMNVHDKSYLELFPKENLIYLTPHCREEMVNYDPDAVYIIGGIVDKINNEPLSLAKAKREGIKMLKFPLDRYLKWSAGSGKSLTLNHCVSILLDLKDTGDWNRALRHVPKRKLADSYPNKNYNEDSRDNRRFNSNKNYNEDSRDNRRFNSNREEKWQPKRYKVPSYMNNKE